MPAECRSSAAASGGRRREVTPWPHSCGKRTGDGCSPRRPGGAEHRGPVRDLRRAVHSLDQARARVPARGKEADLHDLPARAEADERQGARALPQVVARAFQPRRATGARERDLGLASCAPFMPQTPGNGATERCGLGGRQSPETRTVERVRRRPSPSVGTVGMASQARCRGFEPRRPLEDSCGFQASAASSSCPSSAPNVASSLSSIESCAVSSSAP